MSRPAATTDPARQSSTTTIGAEWASWAGAHGGLVTSLVSDVAHRSVPDRPLRALSVHFYRPVGRDPLHLTAHVDEQGRSTATVLVRGATAARPAVLGIATFARTVGELALADRPAPQVPGPQQCAPFVPPGAVPCLQQFEIRPATDVLPLSGASSSELTAWIRLSAGDRIGPAGALILLDALAPAAYARLRTPVPIPTVTLTAHLLRDLTAAPHTGWVLARQRNCHTAVGLSIDECDLWTPDGELIAQARQLRQVVAPTSD